MSHCFEFYSCLNVSLYVRIRVGLVESKHRLHYSPKMVMDATGIYNSIQLIVHSGRGVIKICIFSLLHLGPMNLSTNSEECFLFD